jgi:DNA repair protein RadC
LIVHWLFRDPRFFGGSPAAAVAAIGHDFLQWQGFLNSIFATMVQNGCMTRQFSELPLLSIELTSVEASALSPKVRVPNYFRDHSARLRERLLDTGPAAILDHELLELVLCRAIPRQDVNPLAGRLMERFDDFNGVLSAAAPRLAMVEGVSDAVICDLKIIAAAAARLARARVMNRPVISNWDALIDYCHTILTHQPTEQFRVLFLDLKNTLIADEEQAKGTVDHVPVYPREVVKRALELNASAMILVHNHPSGDPTPSETDVCMTLRIRDAAETLGLTLYDHLIVGHSREISFRAEGLL